MTRQEQKALIKRKLGKGRDEAISRDTLALLLEISPKRIRNLIREMRYENAELICSERSDSNIWYYYYPEDTDDALQLLNQVMPDTVKRLRLIQKIQDYITEKTDGRVSFKNLPDIDEYEREQRSTEEIF